MRLFTRDKTSLKTLDEEAILHEEACWEALEKTKKTIGFYRQAKRNLDQTIRREGEAFFADSTPGVFPRRPLPGFLFRSVQDKSIAKHEREQASWLLGKAEEDWYAAFSYVPFPYRAFFNAILSYERKLLRSLRRVIFAIILSLLC